MSNDKCPTIEPPPSQPPERPAPAKLRSSSRSSSSIDHSVIQRLWYRFWQSLLKFLCVLFYHIRYYGAKGIPRTGGVLVIANHQSFLDPMLVGTGCPRPVSYVARESLFHFKPFGWFIHSVNAFPIDRDGSGIGGIKEALRRLKRGEMVLIFPEGTRTQDGELGQFLPGFTTLAVRSKSAILPVAIDGAYRFWPKSQLLPRPGRIRVCYGRPLLPEEYTDLEERDLLTLVEQRVQECYAQLRKLPDLS